MYSNIKDFLIFQEPEGIIGYREDDLYRFAGPRALIASALVFRLMKEAVKDLSPMKFLAARTSPSSQAILGRASKTALNT